MRKKSSSHSFILIPIVLISFISLSQKNQQRGLGIIITDSLNSELKYEDKYAILIGVDTYDSKSGFPSLKYAANDVIALKNILIQKAGYNQQNIKILLNKSATRVNIINALESFHNDNISENSQLLVFFAGHGTTLGRAGTKRRGFLVPIDGRDEQLSATSIGMDEIEKQAEYLKPKHVLFLVDACYGGLAQNRGSFNDKSLSSKAFIKNVWRQKGREIITAGSAEETVIEASDWQHSAFTKVLIDAIEKEEADINGDGVLVTSELYGYIQQRVPYYAQTKGGKQTPQLNTFTPEVGTFLLELSKNALSKGKINELIPQDKDIKRKLTSHLMISANIENTHLKINDNDFGFNKLQNTDYEIAPGYYKLELTNEKYQSQIKNIEVKPDTITTVNFSLIKKVFDLKINVEPNDALLFVNDKVVGKGSHTIELEKGRHAIVTQKTGYITSNILIDLLSDSLITEKLNEIKATIDLNIVPPLANIKVRGIEIGKSPITFDLPFGNHEIEVWKEDFFSKKFKLDVKEPVKIIQNINLDLNPNGKVALKLISDYWNKKLLTNVGISSLSLLGFLYFNKSINENDQSTTFLNKNTNYKKGNLLQSAKYACLLFGSFEVVNSFYCLKKILANKKKSEANVILGFNGNALNNRISLCLNF